MGGLGSCFIFTQRPYSPLCHILQNTSKPTPHEGENWCFNEDSLESVKEGSHPIHIIKQKRNSLPYQTAFLFPPKSPPLPVASSFFFLSPYPTVKLLFVILRKSAFALGLYTLFSKTKTPVVCRTAWSLGLRILVPLPSYLMCFSSENWVCLAGGNSTALLAPWIAPGR